MRKRILLSLILWGVVFSANAQRSDGFFKNNDDTYNNRDGITINNGIDLGGVTNNENPTEAPIGSGLLIMVAAGAGYAVARRKNAVRKGMTMLVALGLMLGMTQCKKDNVTPVSTDNRIQITLNANYGGNGGRTTFDPATGNFTWLTGVTDAANEYVNVGGSVSGYLGQLSNRNHRGTGNFEGTITTPVSGETLYFFYLGNGNHAGATTLDFSNQSTGTVTNWHIAIGSQEYTGQISFTATLNMAMAIAYFDLSQFTNGSKAAETVYIHGDDVYSTARIDYNNGTIIGNSKGYINAGTAYDRKYVALIPSVETATTLNFNSSSKTGSMTFNNGIKPASYYSDDNNALEVSASDGSGIPGTFSVSATKKVFFSKGNLQYQASTNTWRFAENQYDYVGDATNGNVYVNEVKSNNANIASDYEGWIDLFGWGTGNNPTQTSTTTSDYSTFTDWGTNFISNGEGYINWRTLTKDEWVWVLGPSYSVTPGTNCRLTNTTGLVGTDNDKARFVKGTVNNIPGLIVFPDNYSQPNDASITYTSKKPTYNGSGSNYNQFVVDDNNWKKMENVGAVFIPASGYRNGTTVTTDGKGYYGSSTSYSNTMIYYVSFANSLYNPQKNYTDANVEYGRSVRLVRE